MSSFFTLDAVKNLENLEGGAATILKKIRRRMLRQALNKFKEGVNFKEQEDRNDKRQGEVRLRLEFRIKRRLYSAIKSYVEKNRRARVYMKTMINRLEKFNKEKAYQRWKDIYQEHRNSDLRANASSLVDEVYSLQQVDGNLANDLHSARQSKSKV